jgi:FKBP-type peptidyl-prolyl cis-trans isomerase
VFLEILLLHVKKEIELMKSLKSVAAVAVVMALVGCEQKVTEPVEPTLDTQQQRISYLAATDFAGGFKSQGIALDADAIALAVSDVMAGKEMRLSEDDIKQAMEQWKTDMMAKQEALAAEQGDAQAQQEQEMSKQADMNQVIGAAYAMANAEKEGVVSLDNGLQYKILVEGAGPIPTAASKVEVNYRGTLVDGTEFDSSYKRGETAEFGVTQVIPGWTEVLQMMPEGSKWEVTIPGDLAYGPGGAGELIGPNATLVFEIELIKSSVE